MANEANAPTDLTNSEATGTAAGTTPTNDGAVAGADPAASGDVDPLDAPGILSNVEGAAAKADDAATGDKKADGEGEDDKGDDVVLVGAAPEGDYSISVPEGYALDPETMSAFDPVFRELGLTDAGAQKLIDVAGPAIVDRVTSRVQQAHIDDVVRVRQEWAAATLADPEIGGKNLEASKASAARVFDHYGLKADGPFRTFLNDSGLANYPDMVRVFARIGRDLGEDGFTVGDANPVTKKGVAETLYPNDTPK